MTKLVILFTLLNMSTVLATGSAQTITLHGKNLPLVKAMRSIQKQSGHAYFLKGKELANICQDVNIRNLPLDKAMEELLKNLSAEWVLENGTIVVRPAFYKTPVAISENATVPGETTQMKKTITGKVTNKGGQPLQGASVGIKGTKVGTTTDEEGRYSLTVEDNVKVLVFSMVGYNSKEINIKDAGTINIVLEEKTGDMDEVIVVAYGTTKKSTFTGSAATIGEDVFKNRPITEASQALTGTVPGLQVGTSNGQPGSEPTLRIRGIGSFNAGNDPLIVLDGMPYDNAFSSINPNDIESITVLKDASSAALYGARGANGVLLITTKKGKTDKPKVVASYNYGLTSRQSADYKRMGDKDYMELYWETHRNTFMLNGYSQSDAGKLAGSALLAGLGYNPYLMDAAQLFSEDGKLNPNAINHWAEDTDWYGAITQNGNRHDANVAISGRNKNTDYYTSLGYVNEEGFVIGSGFKRISAKANANSKITNWLKMGTNMNISHSTADGQQSETSGAISNPFRSSRYMGNILPIHIHNPSTGEYILDANGQKIPDFGNGWTSEDGTITIGARDAFPASNYPTEVHNIYNGFLRQTINIKGYADASLIKNLKLTLNGGVGSNMYRSWNGGFVYAQKGNAGSSAKSLSNTTTWTFQQLLNYTGNWKNHHIEALAGHESYQYQYHNMSSSMKTQSIHGNNFEYANFTEINALPTSYTHNYRVEGYLSRINYDYDGKYLLSASYRRDGSSRFYKDVRWGNFWSLGGGWLLEKEKFLKDVSFIDMLKLRASYGMVGNDDLSGYYPWRATYAVNDNGEPGYVQASLGNKKLTWETSKNFDVATEFQLFKNRLRGSFEYFYRISSDLLFSVPQPISSGVDNVDVNAGSMYNRGVELVLDGDLIRNRDFKLSANVNATFLKNQITLLPLDPYPSSVYKIEKGHSRYDFWLKQWYGVNPDNGYNLFKADLDKFTFAPNELKEINGILYTENAEKALYAYSGTAMPSATGGFGISGNWKGLNLKLNFYYQMGGQFYDAAYQSLMTGSLSYFAQHQDLLNRWKKPGDITNIARVTSGTDRVNIEASNSTRWLVSSNMLELTNINLSYNIPRNYLQSKNIADATIYIAADNSLLLTTRKGMYPRRNFYSGYISNSDVYSPSAVISVGLSVTF